MICQTCQGEGKRLNPGLQVVEIHGQPIVHNPCNLPVLVPCPECRGSGESAGSAPSQRMRMTVEDVDGLIREVWQCQPMLTAKRNMILNRLYRVRHNLEILRGANDVPGPK